MLTYEVLLGILVACIVIYVMLLYKYMNRRVKLPPGPIGLPVVGCLPFIGVRHHSFLMFSRQYGSMFSLYLGSTLTVVLCDYRIIRDIFCSDHFTDRPRTPLMNTLQGLGIINSQGELWKNQRRFLMIALRNFGIKYGPGSSAMQERIMAEGTELNRMLTATNAEAVDPNSYMALAACNVISGVTSSTHFEQNDARFARLNHLIEEGMKLFGELNYGEYIPAYNGLPGKSKARNKLAKNRLEMFEFYDEIIQEKRIQANTEEKDLIDMYLRVIREAESEGVGDTLFEGKDQNLQLKQIMSDLFSAGVETIKTTLMWSIVFMLRNPDIKVKVQQEIDTFVGRDRTPRLEDARLLQYTEATILETLRLSNIVPLGTTHSPARDIKLNGYTIPAGTHVIPLINCVHMDPKLWDEPEKFEPLRFINETGVVSKPPFFMPFGVGRRRCLGEVLTRMELITFFSGIMHKFDVQMDGDTPPTLEGVVAATVAPVPFKARFVPRGCSLPAAADITTAPDDADLRQPQPAT